jgi:fructose/tagatose bisphosphate aldolase
MYDASSLPFEDNIDATRRYVERHGSEIVIEGACDSIADVGASGSTPCTPPDDAERYFRSTGVDWIVANLGTEHRAGVSSLHYRDDVAREISRRIGPRLCLHGASSVAPSGLEHLFADGVAKVNLWTALERDSSAELLGELVAHAGAVAGPVVAARLRAEGLLGPRADLAGPASLERCTTAYRQQLVFRTMKRAILAHLRRWYPA